MKLNKILIYLLFICLAFGQLQQLGIFYLHDLIVAALIILNLRSIYFPRPLLIFSAVCLISLFLNPLKLSFPALLASSLYLIRFLAYAALYPIFKAVKIKLQPILKTFILVLAGSGLLQYFFLPDTRWLAASGWDDHYFRAISTLFDPNYFGSLLVLGLILFNFKLWPSLLLLVTLFLTYSRSSYLSLLVVIISYVILKRRFKYLLLGLVFLVIPFLPRPAGEGVKLERLFSITQRLDNYRFSFTAFSRHPLFGIGFNTLKYLRQDFDSHAAGGLDSSLLFVLVTTGAVGFIAYLNFLKSLWSNSLLVKLTLITLLTHSLFQNTLFYPWHLIWLWSVLSLQGENL